MTPVVLVRFLSLDQLKSRFSENASHHFMDCYVLSFTAVLLGVLSFSTYFGRLGGIIAAYRIADIHSYRIFFLLVKSQAYPWTAGRLRRSLVIVVLNFVETIIGFAILYMTLGNIVPTSSVVQGALRATTALYFSAVTAITLGYGDFIPGDDLSRVIVMAQLLGTILFLIFIVPALISVFSTEITNQV
jgi:voltage-gated potassium channel Kch